MPFPPLLRPILAASAAALLTPAATAAVRTWNNAGTDFNTPANWTGGLPGPADIAQFAAASLMQPALSGPITIQQLLFGAAGMGYTVAGPGALTVTTSSTGPGLAALEIAAPGITTISAPLVLGAASGFQAATIAAGASLRITSDISGNAGIVKQGFGTLTLSGNNTFAGGVDHSVQDGTAASTLNINSPTALGTGTFIVGTGNFGVTIDNTSGAALTLSTNNAIATKVNAIINFTGTNDLNLGTGAVTLVGSTATFRVNGGTLTLGGNIGQDTAGRGLTKSGAGTLVLSGTHSYTGTTTVNGGVLRVNGALGASSVTVSSTGVAVFANAAAIGSSGRSVTVTAPGAVVLAGATDPAALLARLVQSSTGTVALDVNSNDPISFATDALTAASLGAFGGPITFGGTLTPNGTTYRLGGGGGALTVAGPLTGGNGVTITTGSTVILIGDNNYTGVTTVNANATLRGVDGKGYLGDSTLLTVLGSGSILSPQNGATIQLRATGDGDSVPQVLTFNNLLTASTAGTNFTVDVARADGTSENKTLALQGIISLGANVTFNLTGANGYNLRALGNLGLGGGGTVSNVTLNPTTANFVLNSVSGGSNTVNPTLTLGGTSQANVIAGNVANNATGFTSVVKSSPSLWTFTGTSAYTGTTSVNAGTLAIIGAVNGTSAVSVAANAELRVNGTVNPAALTTVSGTLSGAGTVGGVSIQSGGTLSPGLSPGVLTAGATALLGGGRYTFELNTDGSGSVGANWDRLAVTTLDLTALGAATPFELRLRSLSAGGPGALAVWNPNVEHTWDGIVTFDTLTGTFSSALFAVNTAEFANPFGGIFSVVRDGNALDLFYTPVPEPSVAALLAVGLVALRRRRPVLK